MKNYCLLSWHLLLALAPARQAAHQMAQAIATIKDLRCLLI
jgi:hypothetical protein